VIGFVSINEIDEDWCREVHSRHFNCRVATAATLRVVACRNVPLYRICGSKQGREALPWVHGSSVRNRGWN
jgi:hypothetical protein